jgi:hypothetical protein
MQSPKLDRKWEPFLSIMRGDIKIACNDTDSANEQRPGAPLASGRRRRLRGLGFVKGSRRNNGLGFELISRAVGSVVDERLSATERQERHIVQQGSAEFCKAPVWGSLHPLLCVRFLTLELRGEGSNRRRRTIRSTIRDPQSS